MGNLNFENRISLTRKSEDFLKAVEELSFCYAKREEFALKNPHILRTMHSTSEVCSPFFVCAAVAIVAVGGFMYAAVVAIVAAAVGFSTCVGVTGYDDEGICEIIDFTTYKNIV